VVFEQMAFQNFAATGGDVQFKPIKAVQGALVGGVHVDQVKEPLDAALQWDPALQGGPPLIGHCNEE